jgi:hypothetical protein
MMVANAGCTAAVAKKVASEGPAFIWLDA